MKIIKLWLGLAIIGLTILVINIIQESSNQRQEIAVNEPSRGGVDVTNRYL